jgi:hypothetical protein
MLVQLKDGPMKLLEEFYFLIGVGDLRRVVDGRVMMVNKNK